MHRQRIDQLTRLLDTATTRRQMLKSLAGAVTATMLAPLGREAGPAQAQAPPARLTGRVVLPSSSDYNTARQDFNKRFNIFPHAIVYCRNTGDVVNALSWARSHGLPISVRSGGHSYEAFSLSPGVVIDLSDMNAVQVDPARQIAVAQPGIRLLDFYQALWRFGVTVPGGTCRGVGLSGLTLGGGIGFLSRKWGLTCDDLTRLELVDASGQVITADQSQHADLFWACRGGGGSFGIATTLTFMVHPIGDVAVFHLEWPFAQAGLALAAWQHHAPLWPDELTGVLEIYGTAAGRATCDGLFLGNQGSLLGLLAPLLAVGSPKRDVSSMSYIDAAQRFAGESTQPYFKAKSDYARAPLNSEAISTVLRFLAASPSPDDSLQFQPYGGAIDRIPRQATAFPHRAGTLFSLQYLAHWTNPADGPGSLRWIRDFYAAMRPFVSGYAYSNNCDLDLKDWQHAYYDANFERLVEIKTQYDPRNVFQFAQSIPPRL